jgi:hypothetical protein
MDLTAAPRAETSSSFRLWFGFLGGMVAYALHLLVGFWIVPAACGTAAEELIPWVEATATLLFLAMAVAATVVAAGARRAPTADRRTPDPTGRTTGVLRAWDVAPGGSTAHFMASTGILLDAVAVLVILFAAVPLLLVTPCA